MARLANQAHTLEGYPIALNEGGLVGRKGIENARTEVEVAEITRERVGDNLVRLDEPFHGEPADKRKIAPVIDIRRRQGGDDLPAVLGSLPEKIEEGLLVSEADLLRVKEYMGEMSATSVNFDLIKKILQTKSNKKVIQMLKVLKDKGLIKANEHGVWINLIRSNNNISGVGEEQKLPKREPELVPARQHPEAQAEQIVREIWIANNRVVIHVDTPEKTVETLKKIQKLLKEGSAEQVPADKLFALLKNILKRYDKKEEKIQYLAQKLLINVGLHEEKDLFGKTLVVPDIISKLKATKKAKPAIPEKEKIINKPVDTDIEADSQTLKTHKKDAKLDEHQEVIFATRTPMSQELSAVIDSMIKGDSTLKNRLLDLWEVTKGKAKIEGGSLMSEDVRGMMNRVLNFVEDEGTAQARLVLQDILNGTNGAQIISLETGAPSSALPTLHFKPQQGVSPMAQSKPFSSDREADFSPLSLASTIPAPDSSAVSTQIFNRDGAGQINIITQTLPSISPTLSSMTAVGGPPSSGGNTPTVKQTPPSPAPASSPAPTTTPPITPPASSSTPTGGPTSSAAPSTPPPPSASGAPNITNTGPAAGPVLSNSKRVASLFPEDKILKSKVEGIERWKEDQLLAAKKQAGLDIENVRIVEGKSVTAAEKKREQIVEDANSAPRVKTEGEIDAEKKLETAKNSKDLTAIGLAEASLKAAQDQALLDHKTHTDKIIEEADTQLVKETEAANREAEKGIEAAEDKERERGLKVEAEYDIKLEKAINEAIDRAIDKLLEINGKHTNKKNPAVFAIQALLRENLKTATDVQGLQAFLKNANIESEIDRLARETDPLVLKEEQVKLSARISTLGSQIQIYATSNPKGTLDQVAVDALVAKIGPLEAERSKLVERKTNVDGALAKQGETRNKPGVFYSSPEQLLGMINFYYAKLSAGSGTPDHTSILEETQRQMSEAKNKLLGNRSNWEAMTIGLIKPSLTSVLKTAVAEDPALKKVTAEQIGILVKSWNDPNGVDSWIQGLEVEESAKFGSIVPKLIGHLEVAVERGWLGARVRTGSLKRAEGLLRNLRQSVHRHSMEQAEAVPGGTVDKMGAYFKSLNSVKKNSAVMAKIVKHHQWETMGKAAGFLVAATAGGAALATLSGLSLATASVAGISGTLGYSSLRTENKTAQTALGATAVGSLAVAGLGALVVGAGVAVAGGVVATPVIGLGLWKSYRLWKRK